MSALLGAVGLLLQKTSGVVPKYAYWRIYITDVQNAGNGYGAFAEAEFLKWDELTGKPANVVSSNDNGHFSDRVAGRVFDGNFTNQWTSSGSGLPWWVSVRYNAPIEVADLRIWPTDDNITTRSPKDFLLQGSDDGATWLTVAAYSGVTGWTYGEPKTFVVANAGPKPPPEPEGPAYYRWRILTSALNGDANWSMQEMEAYEDNAVNVGPTCTATASSTYNGDGVAPQKVFDGDYTNYLNNIWVNNGQALPQWFQMTFPVPRELHRLKIFPQNYGGGPARSPKDFKIQHYDPVAAAWVTDREFVNITSWAAGAGSEFLWGLPSYGDPANADMDLSASGYTPPSAAAVNFNF